jgi:protein-L-isoaspartate(D-aspartate) O-methyltransferase
MGRFDDERREMVALIEARGVANQSLLQAMLRLDRHAFVPEPFTSKSYEDSALPIGDGQTISQPYTVAFMTEALGVVKGDKVLEVGTGSGYQAAVLAELGVRVFSIERNLALLSAARRTLDALGYRVATKGGDGTIGWKEFSPYNGIIVTAGAPEVPKTLLDQLDEGGRMVIPVGSRSSQTLVIITRQGSTYHRREADGFRFVPLIGKAGW